MDGIIGQNKPQKERRQTLDKELEDYKQSDIPSNSTTLSAFKDTVTSLPSQSKEEERKDSQYENHKFPHLPCFDLPDLSQIWFDGKIQFKKDAFIDEQGEEFTVEGVWLNGKPHGICIVENDYKRGIMVFIQGKLGGPTLIEAKEDGTRVSC